jgi:hypothetical protein
MHQEGDGGKSREVCRKNERIRPDGTEKALSVRESSNVVIANNERLPHVNGDIVKYKLRAVLPHLLESG